MQFCGTENLELEFYEKKGQKSIMSTVQHTQFNGGKNTLVCRIFTQICAITMQYSGLITFISTTYKYSHTF